MFKKVILFVILTLSSNAYSQVNLDLREAVNGIYVKVDADSKPISNMEINVINAYVGSNKLFTDDKGELFIPTSFRSSRFVKIEALESGVPIATNSIYLSADDK
ncbi:hypothetical protein LDJ79_17850 [Vibrio tritonius]|uniref:Uncharacterized protein n=1 Tax=Vibrio tritonius TaxID=1435069 RepID=A0ABS7YU77_9VIBR|nr:hypothetical protein [Vibrio tritonius]MCA2017989.1 hypothetical protein [Vibrio tritonius]